MGSGHWPLWGGSWRDTGEGEHVSRKSPKDGLSWIEWRDSGEVPRWGDRARLAKGRVELDRELLQPSIPRERLRERRPRLRTWLKAQEPA